MGCSDLPMMRIWLYHGVLPSFVANYPLLEVQTAQEEDSMDFHPERLFDGLA